MKKIPLSILVLIITISGINAQKKEEVKNLQIGDKVPNIRIKKIINGPESKAKIADFKDQLLILDLLHTKCGGCLHALPGMDSLQSKFGEQIKIMVVTFEKENDVRDFLREHDQGKYGKLQIPWVVEDDILKEYFKHTIVSHLVWIYKGEVVAITDKHQVTANNIRDILNGKQVKLPVKNDLLSFNFDNDFFTVEPTYEAGENEIVFYSAIRGHIKGIDPTGNRFTIDSVNKTIRYHIANRSILNMYLVAWSRLHLPYPGYGRIIMEVEDPSKYEYKLSKIDYNTEREAYSSWGEKNEITYESVLPLEAGKKGAYKKLISDLDHFLGLHGRWEKRKVPCLLIVKAGTDEQITAKKEAAKKLPYYDLNGLPHNGVGGKNDDQSVFRRETNLKYLTMGSDKFGKPLVNASQYEGTIIFPQYSYEKDTKDDLQFFKKGLNECGFDLIEKEYETDVFVLTEVYYDKIISSVSPEMIKEFANQIIRDDVIEVVMDPE